MSARVCAFVAIAMAAAAANARAQPPMHGRFEVSVGPAWFGGASMTPLTATETQADGTPRTVFDVSRDVTSAVAVEARVGVRATSRVTVAASGSYARPMLELKTSNDVEGAAGTTASEPLQEFTVGGAVVFFPRPPARTMPFVTAGAAFARQLHQASTLANSGVLVDAGGGVDRVLSARAGRLKAVGIRAEARARVRSRALALDGNVHVSPLLAASLFVRF